MKNTQIKLLSLGLFLMSNLTYAQAVRRKINEILAEYIIPTFIIFMIIAVIAGLVRNYTLIEDANNEGTRTRGFTNVGMLVLYVFIAEIIIVAIVAILGTVKISI